MSDFNRLPDVYDQLRSLGLGFPLLTEVERRRVARAYRATNELGRFAYEAAADSDPAQGQAIMAAAQALRETLAAQIRSEWATEQQPQAAPEQGPQEPPPEVQP